MKKNRNFGWVSQRGQTALLELMVGTILVLLIVLTLIRFWETNFESGNLQRFVDDFDLTASKAIDRLANSPGSPSNWEKNPNLNSVRLLGLAKRPGQLDLNKFNKFLTYATWADGMDADYNKTKELLGIGNLEYEIEFTVYKKIDLSESPPSNLEIQLPVIKRGKDESLFTGNYYVITKSRIAALDTNDQIVVIQMKFFYPKR